MLKAFLLLLCGALLGVGILPYFLVRERSLPPGTDEAGAPVPFTRAELLIDRTLPSPEGGGVVRDHAIFNAILHEIREAETFIVADFFLWNPWKGALGGGADLRPLASELADALVARKLRSPELPVLVLTDPINRVYGDLAPELFDRMAEAGIPVVFTDLSRLPESNRVYGPQYRFWRRHLPDGWGGFGGRWFPNPFEPDARSLTTGELARLLRFKANHRKVLVTGRGDGRRRVVVGSFNPADGSANHSNLAALVEGPVAVEAARSELALAGWSAESAGNLHGATDPSAVAAAVRAIKERLARDSSPEEAEGGGGTVAWRTEAAIRRTLLDLLGRADADHRVDVALFYLSDRKVVEALKDAAARGAAVRLLLDPNKDAFGREKNGVPNRPVAAELMKAGGDLRVRWANTHGEQFHAKALRVAGPEVRALFLGSANWTRRNLANLNLEANLLFENAAGPNAAFDRYFESVWTNARGVAESVPYGEWAEEDWSLRWKTWLYRFQEWSGASTF